MAKIIQFLILQLNKILLIVEKRSLPITSDTKESINTLAPKIITEEVELKKIDSYLTNLKKAINTEDINNIALTGSYGSGKSTILKTFQHYNPQFKYLNISLASFKDNKDDPEEKDFERKLEISILQQIFYHVKPSIIPDSRFKRIVNLTTPKLFIHSAFLLLWVLSAIILFKFDYVNKLNPISWQLKYKLDWLAILLILVFLAGIGLFVKSIVRLFSNSKISKFNIKGEVELGEAIDKSVFNQHLEEILYFFERTDFNVVIIEDVDRFGSTDIFTKLREINILINNSNLITQKVKFVYAIKDEMFTDKNERVKFFEFIIPVIPFINPSNAGEQLTKLINAANLQGLLSTEFTNDVITFIDDIDMRLLINIFHEYQLYSTNLSKELEQDNLFAIIVYKNMFPDDFGELPKRKGNLYKILSNKNQYSSDLINSLNSQIISIDNEVKQIEAEIQKPVKELRAVYINRLIPKLPIFHSFYINGNVSIADALEDKNFNSIKNSDSISYTKFTSEYYTNEIKSSGAVSSTIKFSTIEKEISTLSYNQREKNLLDKLNGQINKLKLEKEQLKSKIAEIESLSIKEIFELVEIDKYLNGFKENLLIRNLLVNGYINENYNDYISIFHGVNLTNEDFMFERNVKSGVSNTFDYQLTKTENLIKRLPDKYFKREVILNYILLDCLLTNKEKYPIKVDNFFKLLIKDNEKNNSFILDFIEQNISTISAFTNLIVKYKSTFWSYFKNYSGIRDERVRNILKLIFTYGELSDINHLNELNSLITYLEEMQDFVEYSTSFSNTSIIKQFIQKNNVSFQQLDSPKESTNAIFKFIYDNNYYRINSHNIEVVIKVYSKETQLENLNKSHYSIVKKLSLPVLLKYIEDNIETYVENVLLKLPENSNEEEAIIIELLNKGDINNDLKSELIELQNNQIKLLNNIEEVEVKEILLNNNKLTPTWRNIFDYVDSFEEQELNDTLIYYLDIKENYESLSTSMMNTVEEKDDTYIENFATKLIYCESLEFNSYTNLLKSIPYIYDDLEYKKLTKEKVDWMISNKFIAFTIENFNGIKQSFPTLHIKFIEAYEAGFVKRFSEFSLDSNDWFLLFKSSNFTLKEKIELIKNIDDNIIIQNPKIAEIVCYLLPTNEYISLRYEVLFTMFKANPSVEKRIELLNIYFDKLDEEQIQKLTEQLGDDYSKIFMKQHKPVFNKADFHYTFFEKLRQRGLIIRYEDVEKSNEIKVFAKY